MQSMLRGWNDPLSEKGMALSEERKVIRLNPLDLDNVAPYFQRLTGIDPDNVPKRYGNAVSVANDLVARNTSVGAVVMRVPITERNEDSVTLSTGHVLPCPTCSRALVDSQDAILFVLSLRGMEDIKSDDMLEDFFIDMWASAFAEAAQTKAVDFACDSFAANEGMKRTHIWGPGQHDVEFEENQKAIFDILEPDDIGCVLTESLMMSPVKSASGIFGIVPADAEVPKPCSHCPREERCAKEGAICPAL